MQKYNVKVIGMTCGHCSGAVKRAIESLGAEAQVDLSTGNVCVNYDETKITAKDIENAIVEQGYDIAE